MNWPNRVWEMGDTLNGKQLWWSREPTKEDHARRREYEEEVTRRILERA